MKTGKVYIIHGWGGHPGEGWFPWLKAELEKKGFDVTVPAMPETEAPKIKQWVGRLAQLAAEADEKTFFVGHSIGGQTILRYLESLSDNVKVGRVVLVAPWMELNLKAIAEEGEEALEIARQWMDEPIDFGKIKNKAKKFIAVFSDNDPLVPLSQKEVFAENLGAKIIVVEKKGHFSGEDGVSELPVVLNEITNQI